MKRAVITGLGIVSSIGNNQQETMPKPVITARFIKYLCKSHYFKFRVAQ